MFSFDFSSMTPVQIVIAFQLIGFGVGILLHFVAVVGTAARWALNASSGIGILLHFVAVVGTAARWALNASS